MTPTNPARIQIRNALIVAGIFLAFSAALAFLAPSQLSDDLRQRLLGAALGAIVVFYGNAAAKTLTPLARLTCAPDTEQALRRFSAWCITLGGLSYVLAYLVAPIDHASVIATALLGAALLLVVARFGWTKARGGPRGNSSGRVQ